jgi:hypothetical protein
MRGDRSTRSALYRDFVSALVEDFKTHGKTAIAIVRVERPDTYLKVIASLCPRELIYENASAAELSDTELAEMIQHYRTQAVPPPAEPLLIEHEQRDELAQSREDSTGPGAGSRAS